MFHVQLRRFGSMMIGVMVVPLSGMGVVSGFLMIARLMMFGGPAVVLRCPFVMLGGLQMVLRCLFRHIGILSRLALAQANTGTIRLDSPVRINAA
jgi:hypothetical protein